MGVSRQPEQAPPEQGTACDITACWPDGTQRATEPARGGGWGEMLHWRPGRKQVFISINSLKSASTLSLSKDWRPLGPCCGLWAE